MLAIDLFLGLFWQLFNKSYSSDTQFDLNFVETHNITFELDILDIITSVKNKWSDSSLKNVCLLVLFFFSYIQKYNHKKTIIYRFKGIYLINERWVNKLYAVNAHSLKSLKVLAKFDKTVLKDYKNLILFYYFIHAILGFPNMKNKKMNGESAEAGCSQSAAERSAWQRRELQPRGINKPEKFGDENTANFQF